MSLPRRHYLILSCEHGGNRVFSPYGKRFSKKLLTSHRGYDPGALAVACDFAAVTGAPLFYSTISRLLVELNRPLGHPHVFFLTLPEEEQELLLRRHYFPYCLPGDCETIGVNIPVNVVRSMNQAGLDLLFVSNATGVTAYVQRKDVD
jgi:hypothetical protein